MFRNAFAYICMHNTFAYIGLIHVGE